MVFLNAAIMDPMKKAEFKKIYLLLLAASIVGGVAVLPFVLTSQPNLPELQVPFAIAALIQAVQSLIVFAVVIFLGLKLAGSVGVKLPVFQTWARSDNYRKEIKKVGKYSIKTGAAVGLLVLLIEFVFILTAGVAPFAQADFNFILKGLLASLYRAINEEIMMRLFLVSLIAWIVKKLAKINNVTENNMVMWGSIVVAAVIFGLGHLPLAFQARAISLFLVFRILFLNSIAGVVFGYFYWKRGLFSAMLAHFSADVVLLVVFPFLQLLTY